MNTVDDVLAELKKKASAKYRATMLRHGAPESLLGVSVADLKVIAKKIKGNQALALALYDS
jgi:3-methyladenine DNA glycosylase AlkD